MKVCNRCGAAHPATDKFFYKNKRMPDGLLKQCKQCTNSAVQQFNAENLDAVSARRHASYEKHKVARLAKQKEYVQRNSEKVRERARHYREKNRVVLLKKKRDYQKCNNHLNAQKHEKIKADPERFARYKEMSRRYTEKNRRRITERQKRWLHSNPTKKLAHYVSCQMNLCLRESKGGRSWKTLVGYSIDDLKSHLESQFQDGMTWENYGRYGWHVDHKLPIASFNFTDADDPGFAECWALENLQPLWGTENCSKNAKIVPEIAKAMGVLF